MKALTFFLLAAVLAAGCSEAEPPLSCLDVAMMVGQHIEDLDLRGEAAQRYWDSYAPDCEDP